MHILMPLVPFLVLALIIWMYQIPMHEVVLFGVLAVPVTIGLAVLHKWDIRRRHRQNRSS